MFFLRELMVSHAQARDTLKNLLAMAGLALMLGAIPVHAETIFGLAPSSSGSLSLNFDGSRKPIDVTLPADLSGTGSEFDGVGDSTVFSPAATDLTPFSSSDEDTTLTADADLSSSEVYLGNRLRAPEPSSLSLAVIGLIAVLGPVVIRRKFRRR
jgi:hypothetical protein